MSGELTGGWGFVLAAYGDVWNGLAAYGIWLVGRYRGATHAESPPGDDESEMS